MDFLNLAIRNLGRNSKRSILTMLSTALSMFIFLTLAGFSGSADCVVARSASSLRIAVHNKAGLIYLVPEVYKRTIAGLPHVEAVAAQTWFGGVYHDISDQFANLAVDPDSIDKIWPDWGVSPIAVREFKRTRIACLVGRVTMKTNHWRIGQRIVLRGTEYPVDVTLTIVGTLGPNGMPDLVVFRRDYLEEAAHQVGKVSLIWVKVDCPQNVSQVIAAIDETFANSSHETKSEAEAPFLGSFLASCQMLVKFARLLCVLVLAAITLVGSNTAAMSIRERRAEVAVMRAIGFTPGYMATMLLTECAIIGLGGGLIGCIGALALSRAVAVMPAYGFVGALEIPPWLNAGGVVASVLTATVGGLIPALGGVTGNIVNQLRSRGA